MNDLLQTDSVGQAVTPLSGFTSSYQIYQENQQDLSFDTASISGSYVGKSKLQRAKSAIGTRRGNIQQKNDLVPTDGAKKESKMRVYIPKAYYKHVGAIKNNSSVATSIENTSRGRAQPRRPQIPFKDRFNEKLEYPAPLSSTSASANRQRKIINAAKKQSDTLSVISRTTTLTADNKSQVSRTPSTVSGIKRRIFERINQMEENNLINVGKEVDVSPNEIKQDDRASIITQDKLKMFNDFFGNENGLATKEDQEEGRSEEEEADGQVENPNEAIEDEQKDEVRSLHESIARSRSALACRAPLAQRLSRATLSKANSQVNDLYSFFS